MKLRGRSLRRWRVAAEAPSTSSARNFSRSCQSMCSSGQTKPPFANPLFVNSAQTIGIVKTSGFTRAFVRIGDFTKFKSFLVEFLENRRSLRKSKTPRKSHTPQKTAQIVDFSEPRLLQCTYQGRKNHDSHRRDRI